MGIFVSEAGLEKYGPNDEIHNWYKLEQSRMGKAPPRSQVSIRSRSGSVAALPRNTARLQSDVDADAWAHRTNAKHEISRNLQALILSEKTYPVGYYDGVHVRN